LFLKTLHIKSFFLLKTLDVKGDIEVSSTFFAALRNNDKTLSTFRASPSKTYGKAS
jgi:hypothetical protein